MSVSVSVSVSVGPWKKKQDDDDKPKQKEEVQMVLNEENVKKKLDELMAQRGKRGTSKKDQIAQLEHLSTATIPPVMSAMVLVHLIAAQFDTSMTRQSVAHMPISFEVTDETTNVTTASRANCLWTKCMHNVRKLLLVLRENPELTEEATGQQSASQVSILTHAHTHTHSLSRTHARTHTHARTRTHARTHARTHTRTRACSFTHAHIHV